MEQRLSPITVQHTAAIKHILVSPSPWPLSYSQIFFIFHVFINLSNNQNGVSAEHILVHFHWWNKVTPFPSTVPSPSPYIPLLAELWEGVGLESEISPAKSTFMCTLLSCSKTYLATVGLILMTCGQQKRTYLLWDHLKILIKRDGIKCQN